MKKRQSKPKTAGKAASAPRPSSPWRRRLARVWRRVSNSDRALLLVVLVVAAVIRLAYLIEYREVPFYDRPYGDSGMYHQRALEIASGDILGGEAYFLGSPLYPYFLAAIYKIFGVNFTLLLIIQFLIGAANCALIYLLTRAAAGKRPGTAFLAGLMAAGYGTMVYFDGTLLMTTLELFFCCTSLLLLVAAFGSFRGAGSGGKDDRPRVERRRTAAAVFFSGLLLGLAGLGRPNVLVFAPFGLLWIFTGFEKTFEIKRWRHGVLFVLGCVLAVAPVTVRNYTVSKDFVLVSSSAGINLYIGNNESADGTFGLPDGSGLDMARLYQSSKSVAEAVTGEADLKPSQVSRYWAGRAFGFMSRDKGSAARLLLRKIQLFWNHYEIPNVHNKYYVADAYAPLLRRLFVGFGLIVPLALVGILLALRGRLAPPPVRLYAAFILVYACSVIPFFVTARYRMPVVPFLIVFAALAVWRVFELVERRRVLWLAVAVVLGIGSGVWVNRTVLEGSYWFNRAMAGRIHIELAQERPREAGYHLERAVVELKKAIELSPGATDPLFNLGVAYHRLGHYSGAVRLFETVLEREPARSDAREALEVTRAELERTGDLVGAESIPPTPFEIAMQSRRAGQTYAAKRQFQHALEEDPQHAWAHNELGSIYYEGNEFRKAIAQYNRGLRSSPDNLMLHRNIGAAYYRAGDVKMARRHLQRCLEIDPNDESTIRQLRALGTR